MRNFGVIPFIKLQNDTKNKQEVNGEKWDVEPETTLQELPTRCEPKRSGRASRLQPNRQAKLPVCAVQWPAIEGFIHLHRHSIHNFIL